ncbi:MAG: type III secretion system export apparatus subunit SctR [Gammaproteobacteria bacterium]
MDFSNFSPALIIVTVVSLAVAPFIAVMVTSFTKIVVVLSLLRNALGLQQTPPNVVINGMAMVLSIYVMFPVILATSDAIAEPLEIATDQGITLDTMLDVVNDGKEPMRDFLLEHSSETERGFFLRSAQRLLPEERRDTITANDFIVVVPSFTVSELTAAFQIGVLIFLPFLVIDLIVSNILLALGMMMLPPTVVSLPFKLLLFVLIDGWAQLVHGIVMTY